MDMARRLWHRWLGRRSAKIGSFILLWITAMGLAVLTLLALGINPTLVLSVISAPFWVAVILIVRHIVEWIYERN